MYYKQPKEVFEKFKELCPNMIPLSEEEENLIIENCKKEKGIKCGFIGDESIYDDSGEFVGDGESIEFNWGFEKENKELNFCGLYRGGNNIVLVYKNTAIYVIDGKIVLKDGELYNEEYAGILKLVNKVFGVKLNADVLLA